MPKPHLARWVGDADAFLDGSWRRGPLVHRPDPALRPPLSLADLDALLETGLLHSPFFEMARADEFVPKEAYCSARTVNRTAHPGYADARKVRDQLDKGNTLLLRCVDQWHPATARLVADLSAELGRRIEAFLFVTPPGGQGLPLHRDDADVLTLQISGSKHWYVHTGPTDDRWAPGPVAPGEDPELLLTKVLGSGEVLYIPRGFAHLATGDAGLSVHLSLTIREVSTADLQRALQYSLVEGLRPAGSRPGDDAALQAAAKGLLDHYRLRLETVSPADLVEAARRAQLAQALPRISAKLMALAEELTAAPEKPTAA
ncbi:JmjC domain-containing protein [Streptomyces sp. NBC_00582]|uniref:JmjC domain-containing protein n=1 Tax=Streptomyces sp. NBC_00582 TaxID=2975783 RepID=UPI0010644C63|nr:cupin domain-containing protein [Streptomyces sp. NBC_00582]WUB59212.1 cupin domain-containing protein [Streptomyces sp. NBC_00582]